MNVTHKEITSGLHRIFLDTLCRGAQYQMMVPYSPSKLALNATKAKVVVEEACLHRPKLHTKAPR